MGPCHVEAYVEATLQPPKAMPTLVHNMKTSSSRRTFLSCLAVLATTPTWANEPNNKIGGATFERKAQVAGSELLLNGVGMRAVAWFKAYAAALYLTAAASSAEQVVATPGAKRLQLRMLRELPAAEFTKAFRQGMGRNGDAQVQAQLATRVDQFAAAVDTIGTLREGDLVNLDFDPARGTLFTLNGKPRGEPTAGADFYANLLRAFVGEKPYDEKLKAGLLGGKL
jgi:Chalcone isomerase-like